MPFSNEEKLHLESLANRVFLPSAPINEMKLFSGRMDQIRKLVDSIKSTGQHAIIYGERGVGKTSLVSVLGELLRVNRKIIAPKVNCDSQDNFQTIWKKIFQEIKLELRIRKVGFTGTTEKDIVSIFDSHVGKGKIENEKIKTLLNFLGKDTLLLIIIDEFDRLPNGKNTRLFADIIKTLSDYSTPATLIFVGVAEKVEELISEHQSCERALIQIQMPRMSKAELEQIVTTGLEELKMEIDGKVLSKLAGLSQGLPHYTHLIALHAARKAIDDGSLKIENKHFDEAIKSALQNAQQSIISAFHKATASPRRDNLYKQVLLACALAKTDELGSFQAADIKEPMSQIMKKPYEIPTFSRHLNDFCDLNKGPILKKFGTKRKFRFRFQNPLMQPYVIMRGLSEGLIESGLFNKMNP